MKPIEILQGKWLGHPVHAAVVHLPLALWIGAAVVDALALFGVTSETLARLAFYAVIVGFAGALVAVPTGIADWLPVKPGKPARKLGLAHMLLNFTAAGIFAVNLFLRAKELDSPSPITTAVALTSIVGALVLVVSGYLGSLMAFDYGVAVGRHSKKKWRKLAAESGSNLPPEE